MTTVTVPRVTDPSCPSRPLVLQVACSRGHLVVSTCALCLSLLLPVSEAESSHLGRFLPLLASLAPAPGAGPDLPRTPSPRDSGGTARGPSGLRVASWGPVTTDLCCSPSGPEAVFTDCPPTPPPVSTDLWLLRLPPLKGRHPSTIWVWAEPAPQGAEPVTLAPCPVGTRRDVGSLPDSQAQAPPPQRRAGRGAREEQGARLLAGRLAAVTPQMPERSVRALRRHPEPPSLLCGADRPAPVGT